MTGPRDSDAAVLSPDFDGCSDPILQAEWARGVTWGDLDSIPPREWLYGTKLIRGFTSIFASPGGVGKTAYSFAAGVACASGQALLHDKPHGPLRVWIYNMEDPWDELRRRLKAAILHFGLDPAEVLPNILMNSGKDQRGDGEDGCLLIARQDQDGSVLVCPDVDKLTAEIKRLEVDIFWADPLVMTHQVNESDNGAQERVLREYNRVATEGRCAIALNHHTRKGFVAGDQDSIRGAGATIAAARAGFTLAPMSEKDAEDLSVQPEERRFLVRIDDAKMNLAPRSDKAQWLRLISHSLLNTTPDYPHGDNVQVATEWTAPEIAKLSTAILNEILDEIQDGPSPGMPYAKATQAHDWAGNAFKLVADRKGIAISARVVKEFLAGWLKSGTLFEETYTTTGRKPAKGLKVNNTKRPGQAFNE